MRSLARFLHHIMILAGEKIMKKEELLKKIALLETINDQLIAEIDTLEHLTRELGFSEGIKSLKEAGLELLEEIEEEDDAG